MIKKTASAVLALMCALLLCCCGAEERPEEPEARQGGIWLYGELHADTACLEKELAAWDELYDGGARDLFVELPCYTADFLNEWLRSDSDEILDRLYTDWEGTLIHSPDVLEFYRRIKTEYPETVFHGTDVGHQYDTTGARYLEWLRENGREDSEAYALAQEIIGQGTVYYTKQARGEHDTFSYREDRMTENFVRAYERLSGADVMGIYGAFHTDPDNTDIAGENGSMARQLAARYGDALHLKDLTLAEPVRTDRIQVEGKVYDAVCYGSQDLSQTGLPWSQRVFWRLEDAYADFSDNPLLGDVLPYGNYPMKIEEGQVFVIDYTGTDGTVERKYYRSDGFLWNGIPATQEFSVTE